jgi:hypothetical protein
MALLGESVPGNVQQVGQQAKYRVIRPDMLQHI